MVDAQMNYPYFFPYQVNITPEEAIDCELTRFYQYCIYQKPTNTTQPQPNGRLNIGRTLNPVEIATNFFQPFVSQFSAESLVDWFLRLYSRLSTYLYEHECMGVSRNISRYGLEFSQFFFQCFLIYFKTARENERDQQRKAKSNGGPQAIRICDEPTDTQFNFKDEERDNLLRILIRTEFPVSSKIWSLVSAANLAVLHKNAAFPILVKESTDAGDVAFWALQFALTRFKEHFEDVSILANILLLGTVNGRLIEEFLHGRSEEDREKGRNVIRVAAHHWAKNYNNYKNAVLMVTKKSDPSIAAWEKFRFDMIDLMIELNRETPRQNYISIPWAKTAIKIYMEKCYVKKEWTIEQLYDLCYTILKQRNQLRSDIISAFHKNKDPISAEYWKNFVIDPKIQQFQAATAQPKKNNPPTLVYRSNNLLDMNEVRENFLSIPPGIDVFVIDKAVKLSVIEFEIKKCMESEYAVIGLDSEWSPYVLSSRASILQIAFHTVVFILDLDSPNLLKNDVIVEFVDSLFSNPKIIKIGFQFGEDLIQLRKKLPKCYSLYEPVNLIDMSKVVSQLMNHSAKANLPIDDYIKFPMENNEETKMEIEGLNEVKADLSIEESANATVEMDQLDVSIDEVVEEVKDTLSAEAESAENAKAQKEKERKQEMKIKNLGLSSLCQFMLGKPLDKSEQCSVWTRRPLRKSQMRYAALDSYSILMLYDRCAEWAEKLGMKIVDITDAQDRINTPLPLFFDQTKLPSASKESGQSS